MLLGASQFESKASPLLYQIVLVKSIRAVVPEEMLGTTRKDRFEAPFFRYQFI